MSLLEIAQIAVFSAAIIILIVALIKLVAGGYQPRGSVSISDNIADVSKLHNSNFLDNTARLHEFATLCAAAYENEAYDNLVKDTPALHGLWEVVLHDLTDTLQASATTTGITDLAFQIHRRTKPFMGKTVYAIAFRGTDSFNDFKSNLRWFIRPITKKPDQYDFVRENTHQIVAEIQRHHSGSPKTLEIIATGHSLGGGLAQQAAYATDGIRTVFAYAPTPVTGFYDVPILDRIDRTKSITTFRVFERGEILAWLRSLKAAVYPVSKIHPTIIELRFNFEDYFFNANIKKALKAHSIAKLANNLVITWRDSQPAASSSNVSIINVSEERQTNEDRETPGSPA